MRDKHKKLHRYYRAIAEHLPCSHKQKRQILQDLRTRVEGYLLEHPDADAAQIQAHFGKVEEIAAAYVEDMGAPELLKALYVRRRVFKAVAICVATVILLWAGVVFSAFVIHLQDTTNCQGKVVITEIE